MEPTMQEPLRLTAALVQGTFGIQVLRAWILFRGQGGHFAGIAAAGRHFDGVFDSILEHLER
eukprot:3231904-Rhodomonas_salina.1